MVDLLWRDEPDEGEAGSLSFPAVRSVGFTGTQRGLTPEQWDQLGQWLLRLHPTEANHGDCVGADAQFHRRVRELLPWARVVLHPPRVPDKRAFCQEDEEKRPLAYLTRNRAIVRASDFLLAAPAQREEKLRLGTWSTVRFGRSYSCPLHLILPARAIGGEQPQTTTTTPNQPQPQLHQTAPAFQRALFAFLTDQCQARGEGFPRS